MVDRLMRRARKSIRIEVDDVRLDFRKRHGLTDSDSRRAVATTIFLGERICPKQEIAGIPHIALRHIARCHEAVRLLDISTHRQNGLTSIMVGLDVALTGRWMLRHDAESDERTWLGRCKRLSAGPPEAVDIRDEVIGGKC